MCGITGIYRYKSQRDVVDQEVERMCDVIIHRGPDGHGVYTEGPLGLGHRRLSIIDTEERSNQPMLAGSDHIIVYNGEVYNFIELRAELEKKGVNFETLSDTEVVFKSLIDQGPSAVNGFNGMYAYAYWNAQAQRLVVTRDRLGIKPLYYYEDKEGLVFASDIRSILALCGKVFEPDYSLIDLYMSMGYIPGEKTLLKGIKRLPPGCQLIIENGELKIKKYWDLEFAREDDKGEAHYIEEIKDLLENSIKLQLRSDVPLGVFLSGGVDSSAVVAYMHKLGVEDIKTFSVAWDYGEKFNETKYARLIAEKFGTDHHEYFMSPSDLWTFVDDYIQYMGEPVTEAAAISLYYIAKKTREDVTVVLSGEGADEVFGGYPIYRYLNWVSNYKRLPKTLRNIANPVLMKLHPLLNKYIGLSNKKLTDSYFGVSFYDANIKNNLYTEAFAAKAAEYSVEEFANGAIYNQLQGLDDQALMQYFDVNTWLVDDLLIKADRMSMANSLELRVPFLDHRFMELSAKLPAHYRFKNGETKYLLKKSLEDCLPKSVLYRPKQGFPTPLSRLFREHLKDDVYELLNSEQHYNRGLFNPEVVRKLMNDHFSGAADNHKVLWQLVVLEKWFRLNID